MKRPLFQDPPPKGLIYFAIIILILCNAALALPQISVRLISADNDDLMRLVRIRDWLGGQPWFDNQQYRLLPPQGISLHWSRYIDATIVALMLPVAWGSTLHFGEIFALAIWPSLLLIGATCVITYGTQRLFGLVAAVAAVVFAITWRKYGAEFTPGRIDHHNIQILCATTLFYLGLFPNRRPILSGSLAAIIFAFSLAIGLEMLPCLLLLWGFAVLRFAFGAKKAWLQAFSITLLPAALAFFAGQTAPSAYFIPYCDVLALPIFTLIGTGAIACCCGCIFGDKFQSPWMKLALILAISALGLTLAWPLLGTCLAGPYGNVSDEARLIIDTKITEARTVFDLFSDQPRLVLTLMVPPIIISVMAILAAFKTWSWLSMNQKWAISQALITTVIGVLFALTQIRALNLATPTTPILAGFVAMALWKWAKNAKQKVTACIILLAMIPTISVAVVSAGLVPQNPITEVAKTPPACRSQIAIDELMDLPPALLFTTVNMGSLVLAYTPHTATSAPYHRSSDAFWNGYGGMENEAILRQTLAKTNADYLILCQSAKSAAMTNYATSLLTAAPEWLVPTYGPQQALKIYRVNKVKLQTSP